MDKSSLRAIYLKPMAFMLVASMGLQAVSISQAFAGQGKEDSIQLLLEAMQTNSPELIKAARERLNSEGLSTADQERITRLLLNTETNLREGRAAQGTPLSGITDPPVTAPVTQPNVKPSLEDIINQISKARVDTRAENISDIVKNKVGQTPRQLDEREIKAAQESSLPTGIWKSLTDQGLIDLSQNKVLKETYDTATLDTLADSIIRDSIINAAAIGGVKGLLTNGAKFPGGRIGNFAGISAEAGATFINNANLVFRLIDLYGLKPSEYDKESIALIVFAVSKYAMMPGGSPMSAQALAAALGTKFVDAKNSIGSIATQKQLLSMVFHNKTLANSLDAIPTPDVKDESKPETPTTGVKPLDKKRIAKALLGSVGNAGWSALKAWTLGTVAKAYLSSARQRQRELKNQAFRSYLESTEGGEGFLKLLIVAMNQTEKPVGMIDVTTTETPQTKFILSLARSARMCSPQEAKAFNDAEASYKGVAPKALTPAQAKMRYACYNKLSTERFNQIAREFLTFNAIPADYVASLRLAGRENRLRMAEVLMQFQLLDGRRDSSEVEHFRTVVTKILGFDSLEDYKYFQRFDSFLHERGGMVENEMSPMGFSVANMTSTNPYDLSAAYTPADGPDAPAVVPTAQATTTLTK